MAGRTLKKRVRESIVAILSRYDAEMIAIFGSYARGEARNKSDIDILVRFARPKSLIQIVALLLSGRSLVKKITGPGGPDTGCRTG